MAHRANVIQGIGTFQPVDKPDRVIDPVCGKELDRRTVKNMLFRPDATYYFCSKECQEKFPSIEGKLSPDVTRKAKVA